VAGQGRLPGRRSVPAAGMGPECTAGNLAGGSCRIGSLIAAVADAIAGGRI
jgi:hypothetical protein